MQPESPGAVAGLFGDIGKVAHAYALDAADDLLSAVLYTIEGDWDNAAAGKLTTLEKSAYLLR